MYALDTGTVYKCRTGTAMNQICNRGGNTDVYKVNLCGGGEFKFWRRIYSLNVQYFFKFSPESTVGTCATVLQEALLQEFLF